MILFGAGGHAKVIVDILKRNNITIDRVLDDNSSSKDILGVVVEKNNLTANDHFEAIISIGNNEIRKDIAKKYSLRYQTAIHPKSVIASDVEIGEGTVVMANASINPDVKIGKHCIINTNAVVEHDCEIGDYVHISPNAAIAGNVGIGEGTHVGIGASVIQGLKVGTWVKIGAGAVIIEDIPDFATVVGNPGKIIKIKNSAYEF